MVGDKPDELPVPAKGMYLVILIPCNAVYG